MFLKRFEDGGSHRKVVAGRSSVSRQMANVFLSDNIFVYKFHTSGRRDHHEPFSVANQKALYNVC